ncbi:MAG: N-acetyl-gamma-glutamyl-phosphate reductase [bacterium]
MIHVGVIGATGYTGIELVRLLLGHPEAKITAVTSEKSAGQSFSQVFPAFQGIFDLPLEPFHAIETSKKIQVAFLCLPHQSAMEGAWGLRERGIKVIDLSADFRLKSLKEYEQWYGKHSRPELLKEAVYGLPELNREKIKGAKLLANPGCYPTSAALALMPLIQEKLITLDSIVVDSKSGVSGAGRSAEVGNLFSEVNEGFKAYKVGNHRHTPEIEQTLSDVAGQSIKITFTPHLVPMDRGILTTAYAKPLKKLKTADLLKIFKDFYKKEPFVRIKPEGVFPNTRDVRTTNFCDIGCHFDERAERIVVISAIDNLTKGAAGQAIQNFNLMAGFEEVTALKLSAHIP